MNIEFESFSQENINKIKDYLFEEIKNQDLKIAFEIFVLNKVVYHYCDLSLCLDKNNWLKRKRNTVLYFEMSSSDINKKLANDSSLLVSKYGLNLKDYCITPGAIPIILKDLGVIGALSISGLEPIADDKLAKQALKRGQNV